MVDEQSGYLWTFVAWFAVAFTVLTAARSMSTHEHGYIDAEASMPLAASRAPEHRQAAPTGGSVVAPAPSAAPTPRVAAKLDAAAPSLAVPERGVALDGSLESALRHAAPRHRFVMLTFGNLAVRDHLLNFCHHAAKVGTSHLVGAVDAATFKLLAARGTPAYKTPLAFEQYSLDGANSHSSQSWKRFASMRTGEVARVVLLGYHVLHTDTDVIWLRDPTPYIMCTPSARSGEHADASPLPCAPMLTADVAISSDNMGPGRALKGRAQYHAGGTFNSGILLFRPSASGTAFVRAWHTNVASPARRSRFWGRTSDQQVINAMVRRERQWPGVGGRRDSWLMKELHADWEGNLTLGALPLPLFANGHGYFVQAAHERLGVRPYAVHATYSLDWHDGLAKAQRFREAGLWAVDEPSYYSGRFLAFNSSTPPAVTRSLARFISEGSPPHNIGTHAAALAAYVHELRDALALARALGRTLILPRWTCYCDRLWAGSDNILGMKCMYPGSQDDDFLPFACPMDHVLSPHDWQRASYRDHGFLSSPRLPAVVKASIVDVAVVERQAYEALPRKGRSLALPRGLGAPEARRLLGRTRATRDAVVLRIAHARELLCGVGGERATRDFNSYSAPLLRVPPWCARCEGACRKSLPRWLSPQQIDAPGTRRRWGGEWCLHTPPPPPFELGRCQKDQ